MKIKDSGTRRNFESGAVRDIQEGKGRCDLLPLDVVAHYMKDDILKNISEYVKTGNIDRLEETLNLANEIMFSDQNDILDFRSRSHMILEVSKHFEEGAKKYGEFNWQKGIPQSSYIDSSVRHYLKWLRGDTDEPHDRAFVWNILCLIWTAQNIKIN